MILTAVVDQDHKVDACSIQDGYYRDVTTKRLTYPRVQSKYHYCDWFYSNACATSFTVTPVHFSMEQHPFCWNSYFDIRAYKPRPVIYEFCGAEDASSYSYYSRLGMQINFIHDSSQKFTIMLILRESFE